MTKKIAFYNPTNISFGSGPEIFLTNLLPKLKKENCEITLFTTTFNKKEEEFIKIKNDFKKNNITIIELKHFILPFSGSPIPLNFLFKIKKFDYFYVFNGFAFQDLFGYFFSKISKSKYIYGVNAPIHTKYFLHNIYQILISKILIKISYKVHVLNKNDENYLNKINENIELIGLGINDVITKEKKEYLFEPVFKIIYVGRISSQKNILKLIETISLYKDSNDIHFYIAGTGEQENLVRDEIKSGNSNLTYLGRIENQKLHELYKDKHLFINLSLYETFCLSVLEALSAGLPVIATKTFGICSDYNIKSILTLPINSEAVLIANKINDAKDMFFNDKEKYASLCYDSIKSAENFLWSNIVKEFTKKLFN